MRQKILLVVLAAAMVSGCGNAPSTSSLSQELSGGPGQHAPIALLGSGSVKKSLFVQLSTLEGYPDSVVREWFSHVCAEHKDPAKDDYIYNLVLQDIADEQGRLYKAYVAGMPGGASAYHLTNHKLDVIADYFPCFDNLFVGTVFIPWHGAGNMYKEGIADASFRWRNIDVSTTALDRFIANYGHLVFHFYVSYEANLNYFTDGWVKDGFLAYNLELINRMRARRPGTAVLWSPTFWTRYGALSTSERARLTANLQNHFARLASESAAKQGITWLDFQDHLGGSACDGAGRFTVADIQQYYRLLTATYAFASLRVNEEQFRFNCATYTLIPADPSELHAREEAYRAAGLPVGSSWEIRFWRSVHTEL